MAIVVCGECQYWKQNPGGKTGRCHRSDPVAAIIVVDADDPAKKQYINAKWPSTWSEDGCGDGEVA